MPIHSGRAPQSCMVQGADTRMGCGTGAHDAPDHRALCVHLSELPRHCDVVTFLKFLNSFIALELTYNKLCILNVFTLMGLTYAYTHEITSTIKLINRPVLVPLGYSNKNTIDRVA